MIYTILKCTTQSANVLVINDKCSQPGTQNLQPLQTKFKTPSSIRPQTTNPSWHKGFAGIMIDIYSPSAVFNTRSSHQS